MTTLTTHQRPTSNQKPSAPKNQRPELTELTEEDLQTIVGTGIDGIDLNHNETLVNAADASRGNAQF